MSVRSGPSPQKQLWGQECETQTFRRLPDLNQSHRPATESPIESCTTAKCRVYSYLCRRFSSLFKEKATHLAKRQSGKNVLLNKYSGWLLRMFEMMNCVEKGKKKRARGKLLAGYIWGSKPRAPANGVHPAQVFFHVYL